MTGKNNHYSEWKWSKIWCKNEAIILERIPVRHLLFNWIKCSNSLFNLLYYLPRVKCGQTRFAYRNLRRHLSPYWLSNELSSRTTSTQFPASAAENDPLLLLTGWDLWLSRALKLQQLFRLKWTQNFSRAKRTVKDFPSVLKLKHTWILSQSCWKRGLVLCFRILKGQDEKRTQHLARILSSRRKLDEVGVFRCLHLLQYSSNSITWRLQ